MGTIAAKLEKLITTKDAIKQAIVEQGISVGDNDTFASYAAKIASISGGSDTFAAQLTLSGAAEGLPQPSEEEVVTDVTMILTNI